MTAPVSADLNGAALDPREALVAEVVAAQAAVEAAENDPVTIADVAAAAFVALETLVAILNPEQAQQVMTEFEERAAAFRVEYEAADGAGTPTTQDRLAG